MWIQDLAFRQESSLIDVQEMPICNSESIFLHWSLNEVLAYGVSPK